MSKAKPTVKASTQRQRSASQASNPDLTQLYLRPEAKIRLRRLGLILAAAVLALLWVFAFAVRGADVERPVDRAVEVPSSQDHAHTLDSALPDQVRGWSRDAALDAAPKPVGVTQLTAYADPAGGEPILVLKQNSPFELLGDYEARSGLTGQQRFGRASCGLSDRATQCVVTIKGGLLVAISPNSKVPFEELAAWLEDAYQGLH